MNFPVPVASSSASVASPGLSLSALLGLILWPVLVAAGASWLTWHFVEAQRARDLAMRPPIVVVKSFDWIKHAGHGASVQERYMSGARRLERAVAQLRDHGALVIDASVVRTAPRQIILRTPRGDRR